jgi:uncharacterized membrane protein YcaP (DUF421 family)
MPAIDWDGLLKPTVSLVELFLRGTVVYLFLVAAFRVLRRQAGAIAVADLLVLVLIADAAQNAMSTEYHSVPEGLVLIGTILFWNWALDWLGFRYPVLGRILEAQPVPLVVGGHAQAANLNRQMLSRDELAAQLRMHGIADLSAVRLCNLEGDGHISVLKYDQGDDNASPTGQARGAGS